MNLFKKNIIVFIIILFIWNGISQSSIGNIIDENSKIRNISMSNNISYDWFEHFEDYKLGGGIHGKGGWKGWNNNPNNNAYISDSQCRSPIRSLEISGSSDILKDLRNVYLPEKNQFKVYVFIPNDFEGESYFIMLSDYNDGAEENNKWSLQLRFDGARNIVESEFDSKSLSLIRNKWVELYVWFSFETDILRCYYDRVLLVEKPWTATVRNDGSGYLRLDAIDLYANGASPIYYDDMELDFGGITFSTCNEPDPPKVDGDKNLTQGNTETYDIASEDKDGDDIWYQIDWGDGSPKTEWIGPYDSEVTCPLSHKWDKN
jgi:hypothetical protein